MTDTLRIDDTKLMFHPARVAQWLEAKGWAAAKSVYPLYVEVAPCGACNHRCRFCACDFLDYKPVMLDADMLIARLQEMAGLGVKAVMLAGEGEPLLHKQIDRIVGSAAEVLDVSVTTNGVLLDRLGALLLCSWVKVSLNAGTRDTYQAVHRAQSKDWDTVWRNLADAAKRKGNCTLGIQSMLLPENRAEMFLLAHMVRDAGADYFVVKPYSQHRRSLTHAYESVDYSEDKKLADALATVNTSTFQVVFRSESMRQEAEPLHYSKCRATPFFWCYVMATGDVYGCSGYLGDERFLYGNLNTQTFKEVWEGERRRASCEFVRDGLDIGECRKNCRMDKANRYLAQFDALRHGNFI